jgi:hypothetical protein
MLDLISDLNQILNYAIKKNSDVLTGISSITICHLNAATDNKSAEIMVFNSAKKINKAIVNRPK